MKCEKVFFCVAMRGRYAKGKDKSTTQQLEINDSNGTISNTITSIEKDNYIVEKIKT